MKYIRIIFVIMLTMSIVSCSPDGTNKCYIQVLYNSSESDPYSIEQLSVTVLERRAFGTELHEISDYDYYYDDQNEIYLAELTTRGCCSADIEITFSESENTIVSGLITAPLKPDVQMNINIYPYRPPFFYICYGNSVFSVDEEDRATYGDSLYVKWDIVDIE